MPFPLLLLAQLPRPWLPRAVVTEAGSSAGPCARSGDVAAEKRAEANSVVIFQCELPGEKRFWIQLMKKGTCASLDNL